MPLIMDGKTYRTITYRLLPRTRAKAEALERLAHGCRFVWNECVAALRKQYLEEKNTAHGKSDMAKLSASMRKEREWLGDLTAAQILNEVAYGVSAAYFRFFKLLKSNPRLAGLPRFKKRWESDPSIPLVSHGQSFKIDGQWLWVRGIGYMKLHRRGRLPYALGAPKAGRLVFAGGHWTATIQHEVDEKDLPPVCERFSAVGIDRNVAANGAATSDGEVYRLPCGDIARLEARKKRYQRRMSRQQGPRKNSEGELLPPSNRYLRTKIRKRRVEMKLAFVRRNWAHQVSRVLSRKHTRAVLEDLNTRGMTRSAKGTSEAPGKNVKAKRGLNRSILGSGWGQLELALSYKMRDGVVKVDPAYTSQACSACGAIDKASRVTQSKFVCTSCGHRDNADLNAALNILEAAGHAVIGRGEGEARAPSLKRQARRRTSRKSVSEVLAHAA